MEVIADEVMFPLAQELLTAVVELQTVKREQGHAQVAQQQIRVVADFTLVEVMYRLVQDKIKQVDVVE